METIFTKESMKKAKDSILNLTPFYGEIINFYEKIFLIQEDIKMNISPDPIVLDDESISSYPLIDRESFFIDHKSVSEVLYKILSAVKKENETFLEHATKLSKGIENGLVNIQALIKDILGGTGKLAETANSVDIPEDILYMLIYNSMKPFVEISSEQLSHYLKEDEYDGGRCPVCGSHPYLSVFSENGERSLICEFCNHMWKSKRIFCPFCESQSKDKLKYFYSEETDSHRVDLCDGCMRFIKCVDLRKLDRAFYPPLEILATQHLDMKAKELGYKSI